MRLQPSKKQMKGSADDLQTPPELAKLIVEHFKPYGSCLEPFAGDMAFVNALAEFGYVSFVDWCEIKLGDDFFQRDWGDEVFDWVVTNCPWSKIQDSLRYSAAIANHVVFLMTLNHATTTCRDDLMTNAGFRLKEFARVDWPPSWSKSGFLLTAVHWEKGWKGDITNTDLRGKIEYPKTFVENKPRRRSSVTIIRG